MRQFFLRKYFITHNSFIIADLADAWILETANKFWVAKKVQDIASISNGYTIRDKWDLASANLVEHAIEMGWCESKSEFDFTKCYSDPDKRILSGCLDRQSRTYSDLLDQKGQITISTVMNILRSHEKEPFRPDKGTMSSICGHYGYSSIHQTTGSYVASLSKDLQVHWLTGTSAPCLSVFKPFFFESPETLQNLKRPSLTSADESLWWKHEKLHRLTLLDYMNRAPVVAQKHTELEQNLINQVKNIQKNMPQIQKNKLKVELNELSSHALEENFRSIKSLTETISKMEIGRDPRKVYLKFWRNLSEKNEISLI
jgi:dipeptidase